MSALDTFKFVEKKFENITDKAGSEYINHLMRVRDGIFDIYHFKSHDEKITAICAAYLHDIFEDTDATEEEVKRECDVDDGVIEIVKLLTRDKNDTYMQYIEKLSTNKLAKIIKLADLKDNMDITRYSELKDEVFSLLKRYHKAYNFLINI